MIVNFKNLLRPTYEAVAAGTWIGSAFVMAGIGLLSPIQSRAFLWMAAMSLAFAAYRTWQAKGLWDYKISLAGKAFSFLDGKELVAFNQHNPAEMWLGYGFRWQPSHTQNAYDVLKKDLQDIYPPQWYLDFTGFKHDPRASKGESWIHGLEPREELVLAPWSSMEGHTAIFGTTGAGKTRLFEVMLLQMAVKGDAIFVFDPKGDKDLEQLCRDVAIFTGKPDRFLKFHPAFPSTSIRLDVMSNFNRGTEHASRLASLVGSETGKDTFTAVTWDAINAIGAGERYLGFIPRITTIQRYLSGGVEELLESVLRKFYDTYVPGWQPLCAQLIADAKSKGPAKSKMENASAALLGYVKFYRTEVDKALRNSPDGAVVENLVRIAEYPRDWHSKMVATIIPLLTMLNSEELGKMLSPDYDDMDDERPIFNPEKIIEGRYILYMGLDSLSDQEVGSAIAGITLSNLASVAGAIYNYGNTNERIKIQVLIDEAAEVVNPPLVQLLNKGRGGGFSVTLAAQTYADYVVRMGNPAEARKLLGNCNNVIALRLKDGETQKFVTEQIGYNYIKQISQSRGSGNKTEDHGLEFSGNISESVSEQKVEVFPAELLGRLPDLQYIALLAGGKLMKGRIPKVEL